MLQALPHSLAANPTGTTCRPAKRVPSRTSLSEQPQSLLFHLPGLQNQQHKGGLDKKFGVAGGYAGKFRLAARDPEMDEWSDSASLLSEQAERSNGRIHLLFKSACQVLLLQCYRCRPFLFIPHPPPLLSSFLLFSSVLYFSFSPVVLAYLIQLHCRDPGDYGWCHRCKQPRKTSRLDGGADSRPVHHSRISDYVLSFFFPPSLVLRDAD